jgi:glycyl-tRNA synthetase
MTFQDVILTLHRFWGEQGCLIWNPYNIQVGAGTGNPATLLRVLGPEPWRVGYVEPSIRPDDGRYAENPNRFQMHHQYQVILKPDPGNAQELYLASLEAIGIDLKKHDVRFVEDNWESPALGAWGLGWEVWLDGQEITQFTYFQQAGGIALDLVSVEITYGLERIVLALQGKDSAWEIDWTKEVTYADIFKRSEWEHSKYYFEIASVDALKKVYDTYERESQIALEAGLVIPAYDYVLKCSHLFNVLDTRGAIGVTERASYFRRMRDMTRNAAKAFAAQREELGYPLTKMNKAWGVPALPTAPDPKDAPIPSEPADLLFEIGVEELPADDLADAHEQLEKIGETLFENLRLNVGAVQVFGTPRRLVLAAYQVAPRQADFERVEKGPAASIAFDAEGKPTKAAEGFARGRGVALDDLKVENGYVTAVVKTIGRPAIEVLAEALPDVIAQLKFGKTMRWNASGVAFSRPIRWITALFGEQVIPFTFAGVATTNTTLGARQFGSPALPIKNSADYFAQLKEHGLILNVEARKNEIAAQVAKLAESVGGRVPTNESLLWEVTNLVEIPFALIGRFDPKFLELPDDVLITVMRDKQRYFPVESADGKLLPYFITVHNGNNAHVENVRHGNEHVITARFSDARFFYNADIQKRLIDHLPRLKTLTFQEQLGSMYDKNQRVAHVVEALGGLLRLRDIDIQTAKQAAEILKADLATQMVVEMTSLQGTMGREYALREGYSKEVANAIFEHWLPRGADDVLPQSAAGALLGFADRLDSLAGLIGAGLLPKSTTDPYGLRRAALGIVQILIDRRWDIDLIDAMDVICEALPITVDIGERENVISFITGRLEVWLRDQGHPADIVAAVLNAQHSNPYRTVQGIHQLTKWTQRPDWAQILDGFARCVRITRPEKQIYTLDPSLFADPAENALYEAYREAAGKIKNEDNIDGLLTAFEPMLPAVSSYFEKVLVHAEDVSLRQNRLALLQAISGMARGRADFSQLTGF